MLQCQLMIINILQLPDRWGSYSRSSDTHNEQLIVIQVFDCCSYSIGPNVSCKIVHTRDINLILFTQIVLRRSDAVCNISLLPFVLRQHCPNTK